jgi:hypothetical protein
LEDIWEQGTGRKLRIDGAISCLRSLGSDFWPRGLGFNPRTNHAVFVMG